MGLGAWSALVPMLAGEAPEQVPGEPQAAGGASEAQPGERCSPAEISPVPFGKPRKRRATEDVTFFSSSSPAFSGWVETFLFFLLFYFFAFWVGFPGIPCLGWRVCRKKEGFPGWSLFLRVAVSC